MGTNKSCLQNHNGNKQTSIYEGIENPKRHCEINNQRSKIKINTTKITLIQKYVR